MATRFLKDNKGATLISKVYYFNRKISFILYLLPIKILLTTPSDPILFFFWWKNMVYSITIYVF